MRAMRAFSSSSSARSTSFSRRDLDSATQGSVPRASAGRGLQVRSEPKNVYLLLLRSLPPLLGCLTNTPKDSITWMAWSAV